MTQSKLHTEIQVLERHSRGGIASFGKTRNPQNAIVKPGLLSHTFSGAPRHGARDSHLSLSAHS